LYARNNPYILLAQSIWWISSAIGLQEDFIIHIPYLKLRAKGESSRVTYQSPELTRVSENDVNLSQAYPVWIGGITDLRNGTEVNMSDSSWPPNYALQATNKSYQHNAIQRGEEVSRAPRDIQEDSRSCNETGFIHPDRVALVHEMVLDPPHSDYMRDQHSRIIKLT
jgi:hypothetical protein